MDKDNKEPQEQPPQEINQKAEEYKDMLQRLQADFENYKKRVEKEIKDAKDASKIEVLRKFLPVLDSFEQAMKTLTKQPTIESLQKENESLRKGFELVYKQIKTAFDSEGVRAITDKHFDPYKHEVLIQEESDSQQGTILQEYQKGYKRGDAIVRHSKVKISSGKVKQDANPAKDNLPNA